LQPNQRFQPACSVPQSAHCLIGKALRSQQRDKGLGADQQVGPKRQHDRQ
jgi:hypothetical protein